MSEENGPKIHVDSDWKAEAQAEKDRLAAEEKKAAARQGSLPEPTFAELINMIAMQAVMGLGGLADPSGQRIDPDLNLAKHHIDMLEVLEKKTAGNLADEEKQTITAVLHELRLRYVEAVEAAAPRP